MKRAILLCSLLFLATTSTVLASSFYTCSNVGGIEEWTISIDLEQNEAGFFDNNTWTIIALKSKAILETMPPQEEFVFEGKDTGNGGSSLMQIYFNKTRKAATLLMDAGTQNEKSYQAEDGCIKSSSREM